MILWNPKHGCVRKIERYKWCDACTTNSTSTKPFLGFLFSISKDKQPDVFFFYYFNIFLNKNNTLKNNHYYITKHHLINFILQTHLGLHYLIMFGLSV